MASRKKPKNFGQQFLPAVQKAADSNYEGRPLGMPALAVLATELARLGIPESDAEYLYDRWLTNGFTTGGRPIRNWRAAARTWFRSGWLPSQKGIPHGQPEQSWPSYERVKEWCIKKKKSQLTSRAWGELMSGKFRGRAITNEVDFNAAMEVILAQWLREP